MKLVKIVYGYDILKDGITARHTYDDGTAKIIFHTRDEWQDLLYDIKQNQPKVVIRTAVQEMQE